MKSGKYKLAIIEGEPRIVNKETGEPIPVDEPVFLLRGRDALSVGVIQFYRIALNERNLESDLALGVDEALESFADYVKANPHLVKNPD